MTKTIHLVLPTVCDARIPRPLWTAIAISDTLLQLLDSQAEDGELHLVEERFRQQVRWQPRSDFQPATTRVRLRDHSLVFHTVNQGSAIGIRSIPVSLDRLHRLYQTTPDGGTAFYSTDIAILKAIFFRTMGNLLAHRQNCQTLSNMAAATGLKGAY